MRTWIGLLVCVSLACGDDSGVDDAGRDASTDALVDVDGGGLRDVGSTDTGASDGGTDANDSSDAGQDAGELDGGPMDTGAADVGMDAGCGYLDLGIYIADCTSGYVYVREWTGTGDFDPELCPTYFTVGATRFDTLEEALASDSCAPDCLRGAAMSVSLLRCGRRTGYIVYSDRGEDCDDAYETPDGIFPSVEAWNEAHPCE